MRLDDNEIQAIIENLDQECWQCDGEREVKDEKCHMCNGVGHILNAAGRLMLAFIARHQVELENLRELTRRQAA